MSQDSSSPEELRISGILDIADKKRGGRLLDPKYLGKHRPADPFLPNEFLRRFKLKPGSFLEASASKRDKFSNPKVHYVHSVDGYTLDERRRQFAFTNLTTITPEDHIKLATRDGRMTNRVVDLFCPVGKGTRGLVVAPPRTGKTTLLKDMAYGVLENHPECHVMVLLVDERPEEVTDFQRTVNAEIFASSNDEDLKNHVRIAELCIERAKRLVESGKDVVLFLDSLTRLARVYNTFAGSGRTMSGGVDVRAMEKPRQLFSSARNTEEAGSLTIIASALIETGSRMDDLIFQEFKGTGNMELVLDRKVAEMRIWPAVNLAASGTRREELLLPPSTLDKVHFFRRALASSKVLESAETLMARLGQTKTNEEFLKLLRS